MKTIKILNPSQSSTVVILASNKKEAIEIAERAYKEYEYFKPYKHVSKGNNFYEFVRKMTKEELVERIIKAGNIPKHEREISRAYLMPFGEKDLKEMLSNLVIK